MQLDNLSGQVIKAYRIGERIGAGGFGAVFKAVQEVVEREVAIKIILPEHANHPGFIRRFEIEAQLVARLEHPHIVPLYDYWREPNSAYLVMRYLRSGSLRDSLDENGAWQLKKTVQMVNQIAAALTFAHNHGVVHRDLKSDNILMDEAGNCYLGDFGIAKDIVQNQNLTKDSILGTPAYLAPEQIRGEDASPQSDIYALGILAYETLTASKPFFDVTPATVLFKQLNDPLPNVLELRPELPPFVNDVLQRATSKAPDARFASAVEFARQLQEVLRTSSPESTSAPLGTLEMAASDSPGIMSITQAEMETFQPKNPYKGLRAFQSADAGEFFGRDALIERLHHALLQSGPYQDFLAVVGPSGSGKSSVVRAGLIPLIQAGELGPDLDWYIMDMIPGTYPIEELEAALLAVAPMEMPGLVDQLRDDERGLVRAIKRMMPHETDRAVLVIDQFEEIFTLIDDEDRRTHFLNMILSAVEDPRSRMTIIVTLRADFYDRPLQYETFGEMIRQRTELVLPLTSAELEEAITRPVEQVGVSLEPGLSTAIINDVKQQPGALPLLQYALTELFERRDGRLLTFQAYHDIGGTAGALARRAEEVYSNFDDTEQETVRQLFLRLVTPGEGTEDTRRRVLQSELLTIGDHTEVMRHVIDEFGKYRLLTFDRDPQTRGSTVEVAHEALIRQWERVRGWLDANREGLRLHRRLTASSEDWIQHNRATDFLARGIRLQQLEDWVAGDEIALNQVEREYLEASIAERAAREEAERLRQEREEMLEKRSRDRLRLLAAVAVVAALVSGVLAVFAFSQRTEAVQNAELAMTAQSEAEENEADALIAREAAEDSASEARALALAASARNAGLENETQLAMSLIREAVAAHDPPSAEVLRTLASTVYSPGIRYRLTGHTQSITAVDFSPDARIAVSGSLDGTIRVWEIASGGQINQIDLPDGVFITGLALHPLDGSTLLGTFSDGTARLFQLDTGEELQVLRGHEGMVTTVAFMPDGQSAITGGIDHTARLWDLQTGEQTGLFEGHRGVILQVEISPDGRQLATSSADETLEDDAEDFVDRTVRIWDINSQQTVRVIEPASGFVRALDFSPNGQDIAIGVWDGANAGTVRIYDLLNGFETNRFFAHPNVITDVVFSPDSNFIVSVAWDKVVRVWDIERALEVQTFVGFPERILSVEYDPTGSYLLMGSGNYGDNALALENERAEDTSVWLVDLQNRDVSLSFEGHDNQEWLWTVDISPDGTLAASGSGPLRMDDTGRDTSVRVWDVNTGEQVQHLVAHTSTVDSVVFHPNGQQILSSAWDGQILLWDLETGEILRQYNDHTDEVYRVIFNQDGSQFLSASRDGTVRRHETISGETIQVYDIAGNDGGLSINCVSYSPDETQFLTTDSQGMVRLWDIETGELVQSFEGHTASTNEAIFSPDGQIIASSSWDDTVRLWDVTTGSEIRQFTGHNGNTFGLVFSDDGTILLTTSEDTTIRMWDVNTGDELHRYTSHTDWIQEVVISPDGSFAVSAGQDNRAIVWRIDRTTDSLLRFAEDFRYARPLTCSEREQFGLASCDIGAS